MKRLRKKCHQPKKWLLKCKWVDVDHPTVQHIWVSGHGWIHENKIDNFKTACLMNKNKAKIILNKKLATLTQLGYKAWIEPVK